MQLYEQKPGSAPRGSREHNPRRVLMTHENKGKKYPYSSVRQNTRAKRSTDAWIAKDPLNRAPYNVAAE